MTAKAAIYSVDPKGLGAQRLLDETFTLLQQLQLEISQMSKKTKQQLELLTLEEVSQIFKVSENTIRRWTKEDPEFPQPIIVSGKSHLRWRRTVVEHYLENLGL